jgi:hypothetical protein
MMAWPMQVVLPLTGQSGRDDVRVMARPAAGRGQQPDASKAHCSSEASRPNDGEPNRTTMKKVHPISDQMHDHLTMSTDLKPFFH